MIVVVVVGVGVVVVVVVVVVAGVEVVGPAGESTNIFRYFLKLKLN